MAMKMYGKIFASKFIVCLRLNKRQTLSFNFKLMDLCSGSLPNEILFKNYRINVEYTTGNARAILSIYVMQFSWKMPIQTKPL